MSTSSEDPTTTVGQNADVPRIARPTPRPPADVVEALAAFDSEIKVALIAHFQKAPDTVTGAAQELELIHQLVSRIVKILASTGVLTAQVNPADKRRKLYRVDSDRLAALANALSTFVGVPPTTNTNG